MSEFPGFLGPSNTQASRWSDAERSLNFYTRRVDGGTPKAQWNMYRRPGLRRFCTLSHGPVNALFAQDGRCFAVGGQGFFEVLPSGLPVAWGAVRRSGIAATISSSGAQGHQLLITSGGLGYIFDLNTNVLTQITDDAFPTNVIQGLFFNGAFLVLSGTDGAFSVSALYDGTSWDGLDKGIESQFSDQIVAMLRSHDNLVLFGTRNTAIWVDDGSGGAAGFVPQPGTIIEHGILAPFSAVEVDNTCYYLGQDSQGSRMVWRLEGYTPTRVSTHAAEAAFAQTTGGFNSLGWAYQEQGHTFYVLYVPGLPTTWVYDISTEQWHERDHWDTRLGQSVPYVGVNHAFAFGKHLVGDRLSGTIYHQDMAYFDDRLVL